MECESFHGEAQETSFNSNQSFESTESNLVSEISMRSYEEVINMEESDNSQESNNILEYDNIKESDNVVESDNVEESDNVDNVDNVDNIEKSDNANEFPNEAYADLMTLVTNYKLNNKAGNAIIKFFNKHSNVPQSPLPINIEKGRKFMNNMKFPNLTFKKICIASHNHKEYFLHYQDLIHCIKNILAIPDITQEFALSFENCEVKC
jgi:hypothetical protein